MDARIAVSSTIASTGAAFPLLIIRSYGLGFDQFSPLNQTLI
jgi:hypothetical protein